LATGVYSDLQTFWRDKGITVQTMTQLLVVYVFSVLLYAAETWTMKKQDMSARSVETGVRGRARVTRTATALH